MYILYVSGGCGKVCVILTGSINKIGYSYSTSCGFPKISKGETVPKQLFASTAWHDGDSWLLS